MSDGSAYLSGVLLQMTRTLLDRVERLEQHAPSVLGPLYGAELERIEQVIATPGWTEDDIRAAVNEAVAA